MDHLQIDTEDLIDSFNEADSFLEKIESRSLFLIGVIFGCLLGVIGNLLISSLVIFINPDKEMAGFLILISLLIILGILFATAVIIRKSLQEMKFFSEFRTSIINICKESDERTGK